MRKIYGLIIILSVCGILLKCQDDYETKRDWPRLTTMPVTNISDLGAQFNAEFTQRGDFEILNYGFVWSKESYPALGNSEKLICSGNTTEAKFSAQISTTLEENITYHVRSFVETSDFTVYGKDIEFLSLGSKSPRVISIDPLYGSWGDTIRISGQGFSYKKGNNVVQLGEIEGNIFYVSDTLIKITVPAILNQNSVSVSVSVLGNIAVFSDNFNYLIPELITVSPLTGSFLDTITISGNNFSKSVNYNALYFNDISANIIGCSSNQIKAVVPTGLTSETNSIKFVTFGHEFNYGNPFMLNRPVINSFEPDTAFHPQEIITIFGKNFNPDLHGNAINLGNFNAEIIEATANYLKIRLPDQLIPVYRISEFGDASLEVWTGGQSAQASGKLTIYWHSTWTRKRDFPGHVRENAVGFSIGGRGFYGTGGVDSWMTVFSDFWEYDPVNDSWTQISDFPGNPRAGAVAFSLDNRGYVGTGSHVISSDPFIPPNLMKDFYSYDPSSGVWSRIADFPGDSRFSAVSFAVNGEAYTGAGCSGYNQGISIFANDMWKYNPLSDTWSEIQKVPDGASFATGFNIGDIGYLCGYNDLYKYDGGLWNPILTTDLGFIGNGLSFGMNGKGYFGLEENPAGETNDLWEFDPVAMNLINKGFGSEHKRSRASAFVIGNKAYIIGGSIWNLNEVWEFDPLLPE